MTLSNGAGLRGHLGWVLGVCVVAVVSMEPLATAAPEGRFGWPLQPRPAVVRRFDKPTHDWLPGHRGVDLAGGEGQPVLSAGEGIVVFAGTVADKPVVSIDHPGGLRTTYEPVRAEVPVGERVGRGSRIGTLESGHPGCATPCLHWGARAEGGRGRRGREYLDPLGLLHLTPLRLKPVPTHARSTAKQGPDSAPGIRLVRWQDPPTNSARISTYIHGLHMPSELHGGRSPTSGGSPV